jgi:hypothetical protein
MVMIDAIGATARSHNDAVYDGVIIVRVVLIFHTVKAVTGTQGGRGARELCWS